MAELNKKMFGSLKGKFGEAVFRQRNGKNYIAQKPSSYTAPSTVEFQKRTGKFKLSSKIASAINSVPVLKEIWLVNTPKELSPYNYLISKNYQSVNGDTISGILKIVPDSNVGVRLDTLSLAQDKLSINLHPLTEASLIDTAISKKACLVSVLFLNSPLSDETEKYEVITLVSSGKTFDLATALSFEISLSTSIAEKLSKYQNKSVYCSLITYDTNDVLVNYSSTFSYTVV